MKGETYHLDSFSQKNGNALTLYTVSTANDVKGEKNGHVFKSDVEADDTVDTRCGVGSCKPEGMNCCASIKSFVFFFSIMAVFTMSNTVLLSTQITSLEKQFQIGSAVSGSLLSCNEIGQAILVLFISHFGHNGHIPRILSSSGIIFSIAMLVTALPNFIEPYSLPREPTYLNTTNQNDDRFCSAVNNTDDAETDKVKTSAPTAIWALYIIGASFVVHGMAKSPRRSLSATYVDNNVPTKTKTGVYLSATVAASIFGPAISIGIGSAISSIPVDLSDTELNPKDPRWVGCWWLGFLIFGIVGIVVSIPVFLFPKRLRGAAPIDKDNNTVTDDSRSLKSNVKGLFLSLLRISKSPVFVLSLSSVCIISFSISGSFFFGPKYLQNQFLIPAWKASLLTGASGLSVSLVGTVMGGWITSKFKLEKVGYSRLVLIFSTCSCLLNIAMVFVGCDDQKIHGLTDSETILPDEISQNISCYCNRKGFAPVCGDNDQTFLNPCVAECWNKTESGAYEGCSNVDGGLVTPGMCDIGCTTPFIIYMVLSILRSSVGTLGIMPNYLLIMRSVEDRDKSLAIGIMTFCTSILGWLPAPIVYGMIIDGTCRLWQINGDSRGSCQIYFLEKLRMRFLGFTSGLRVIAVLLLAVVFIVCRREALNNKQSQKESYLDDNNQTKLKKEPSIVNKKGRPITTNEQTQTGDKKY